MVAAQVPFQIRQIRPVWQRMMHQKAQTSYSIGKKIMRVEIFKYARVTKLLQVHVFRILESEKFQMFGAYEQ